VLPFFDPAVSVGNMHNVVNANWMISPEEVKSNALGLLSLFVADLISAPMNRD